MIEVLVTLLTGFFAAMAVLLWATTGGSYGATLRALLLFFIFLGFEGLTVYYASNGAFR